VDKNNSLERGISLLRDTAHVSQRKNAEYSDAFQRFFHASKCAEEHATHAKSKINGWLTFHHSNGGLETGNVLVKRDTYPRITNILTGSLINFTVWIEHNRFNSTVCTLQK